MYKGRDKVGHMVDGQPCFGIPAQAPTVPKRTDEELDGLINEVKAALFQAEEEYGPWHDMVWYTEKGMSLLQHFQNGGNLEDALALVPGYGPETAVEQ